MPKEILNIDTIKYFVSQIALFSSFIIIFSILIREEIINNLKVNKKNFIFSILIIFSFLFIDIFSGETINNYFSITLIIFVYIILLFHIGIKYDFFLTFIIIIFNMIINFDIYNNIKYIVILLITTIIYLMKGNKIKKSLLIWFLSHLYCLIEIIHVNKELVFKFLFVMCMYTFLIYIMYKYFKSLNGKYKEYHGFSHKDYLTGINNERSLYEKYQFIIEKVKKSNIIYSFIYIDLDNLKCINDKYGHRYGDEAIKNVAYIMTQIFEQEYVARKSGDEFCVIFKGNLDSATDLSKKFVEHLNNSYILVNNDKKVKITVSLGVAEINKFTCDKNIFELADIAMYEAKKSNIESIHSK